MTGEWIAVEDRLPEQTGDYLVLRQGFWVGTPIMMSRFAKYYGEDNSGCWYKCFVTHWMPLPEPPKEKARKQT